MLFFLPMKAPKNEASEQQQLLLFCLETLGEGGASRFALFSIRYEKNKINNNNLKVVFNLFGDS